MGRKRLPEELVKKLGSLEWKKGEFLNYPVFIAARKLLRKGYEKQVVAILTGLSTYQVWMIKSGRIDITRWKKTSKTIKK